MLVALIASGVAIFCLAGLVIHLGLELRQCDAEYDELLERHHQLRDQTRRGCMNVDEAIEWLERGEPAGWK